jgi:hypothetical protein
MPEELNGCVEVCHYGFLAIGGLDNPQQFPNYNPAKESVIRSGFLRSQKWLLSQRSHLPPSPNRTLTEPILILDPTLTVP